MISALRYSQSPNPGKNMADLYFQVKQKKLTYRLTDLLIGKMKPEMLH